MTIGIDASRANRDFKTGTEWYSYYLIKNFIELDKESQFILYSDKKISESFLKDLKLSERNNVKVKVLKWPFKFFWTLGRMSIEMIFNRPDILFVPAHVIPFFSPKKTITTIHDVGFLNNTNLYDSDVVLFESSFRKKITRFFVKIFTFGKFSLGSSDYLKWSTVFALKNAKKIITVSNFTRNEILNNYKKVKSDKLVAIYNGYNNNLYRKIDNQEEIKSVLLNYGIKGNYFLYVGRIEKKKNIKTLLQAFYCFKEADRDRKYKLVLVGNIGYGYDELKYLIEELDISEDIIMLGWVEESDMPYLFNASQAFIFPSLYEGFGIPILQAMACGVPVIASDIEVFKEIGANVPLFFSKFNDEDLYYKMELVDGDKNGREIVISRGLEYVKNFSWEKCARETLEEIKNL
ncbi:MAG: glycosyltransferase family 1 protein [Patescibacteria group bacterium]